MYYNVNMLKKIWDLYKKYREPINYLITGGIGTVVSIGSFALLIGICGTVAANIISWVIVVILMYILNRYFVFEKHASGTKAIIVEIFSFAMARVFTLVLETLVVWLGIDVMHLNAIVVKTFAQILVIVLNYFFSKFFIFKDAGEAGKNLNNVADSNHRKAGNVKNQPRKRR